MNDNDAIKQLGIIRMQYTPLSDDAPCMRDIKAIDKAIDALREKAVRDNQQPCEYCCDDCEGIPYPKDAPKYCSNCGRELPANALWLNQPLTLEQLKERVGKPVYVHLCGRFWEWGIVAEDTVEFVGGGRASFKKYGAWLAYDSEVKADHEPKEDNHVR